jgi:hypothetical protein
MKLLIGAPAPSNARGAVCRNTDGRDAIRGDLSEAVSQKQIGGG